ncbi:hypothetical protein RSSM_02328 [Rhodopirellula sallentina SM41]|uniref:Uncharacterized protein n=1 Tax=Rhodopirellula sallentina SM41 TaxID=1263870 RepID=M5U458_9BACT|nr:hypothetical protein RSSM_02328 [Rhodopirellula sallentina SM41]
MLQPLSRELRWSELGGFAYENRARQSSECIETPCSAELRLLYRVVFIVSRSSCRVHRVAFIVSRSGQRVSEWAN